MRGDQLARQWRILRTIEASKVGVATKPFEPGQPTEKTIEPMEKVPGVTEKENSIFNISQILSWLSRSRNDLGDQIERKKQVCSIIKPLLKKASPVGQRSLFHRGLQ